MNPILREAFHYIASGISIIPTRPQTKEPYLARLPQVPDPDRPGQEKGIWWPYTQGIASPRTVRRWFADGRANIAIVTGQVSGGLTVLDFDYEANLLFCAWRETIGEEWVRQFPLVPTSKGFHVYLRTPGTHSSKKLAMSEGKNGRILIELRGEDALVQAPPSVHPSGHVYQWFQGGITTIPTLSEAEFTHLLKAAQLFDRRPPVLDQPPPPPTPAFYPMADETLEKRLRAYAWQAATDEAMALSQVCKGARNDELNRAAFRLGRFVAGNLLDIQEVTALLEEASVKNGYIPEDGRLAFTRTLNSGLRAGLKIQNFRQTLIHRLTQSDSHDL
jgi:hypothetical protein